MDLAIDKFDSRRFGLITGSKCSVLFPDRGDGLVGKTSYAKELASQKYHKYYDEFSTWEMEHGNMAEHEAYDYFKSRFDKTCQKVDFVLNGDFGGTADAVCNDYGVDFKAPTSLLKWEDYLFEGISKQQYHQCQMYMWLYDKKRWVIAAYLTETLRMGEHGLTYPVKEENRMILVEVEKDDEWVDKLKLNSQIVIEKRELFYKQLENHFEATN